MVIKVSALIIGAIIGFLTGIMSETVGDEFGGMSEKQKKLLTKRDNLFKLSMKLEPVLLVMATPILAIVVAVAFLLLYCFGVSIPVSPEYKEVIGMSIIIYYVSLFCMWIAGCSYCGHLERKYEKKLSEY